MSLLTEQEIAQFFPSGLPPCSSDVCLARAIEAKVIEKIKEQNLAGVFDHYTDNDSYIQIKPEYADSSSVCLYRLPEGD